MTQPSEMKLSLYGLTEEQEACFRLGHCEGPEEHRWIGPNFPTPEGRCPFCIDPEVVEAFRSVQIEMLTKEAAMPPRAAVQLPPVSPFQVPPPIADIIDAESVPEKTQQLDLWGGVSDVTPRSPRRKHR